MLQQVLGLLPAVNAVLISTSGLLILLGVGAIRRGDRMLHRRRMLTATGLAAAFLILYLTRLSLGGITPFHGPAALRGIYLFILFTHVLLAMVQTPLVLVALYHGLRENVESHRRIGRFTYPIWVYVSVTGVLVFGLLHYDYP
jgi:putative membrane protein